MTYLFACGIPCHSLCSLKVLCSLAAAVVLALLEARDELAVVVGVKDNVGLDKRLAPAATATLTSSSTSTSTSTTSTSLAATSTSILAHISLWTVLR